MGFPAKFFLFRGVFGGFFRLLFGPGTHPLDLLGALLVPAGQARVVRHLHAAGKAPVQAVPPGQLVPLQDALACLVAAALAAGSMRQVDGST